MIALDVLNELLDEEEEIVCKPNTSTLLPLNEYDTIIVCLSGGKDSIACLLYLLGREDVDASQIELWHQIVDGRETNGLMDWPCTEDYCRKLAEDLGLPIYFQWRHGGFEREMLRHNQPTAPTSFEMPDGTIGTAGGKGPCNTREKFPQKATNLQVRWCSSSLKIDVCNIAINNDPRFHGKKILIVTGERRQESTARSKYAEVVEHSTTSKKWGRRTDQWRAIIDWPEQEVWDLLKFHKVNVHPAYRLGFGRVSCMCCIFGDKNQWASVKDLALSRFSRIMLYEEKFGCTIDQNYSVWDQALRGKSFVKDADPKLIKQALSKVYTDTVFVKGEWKLPKGAFKRCGGPI